MKRKRIAVIVLSMFLLIAGAFLVIKPKLENKKNLEKQDEILTAIEGGEQSFKIEMAINETEKDFYSSYSDDSLITPSPSEPSPLEEAVLLVDGIGVIEIESIDLKLPIVEGVESGKLKVAVGHLPESVDIGQEGNCIIAGHRNYTYGEMFNRLDEINAGDIVKITTVDSTAYEYKVYAITVVEPGSEKLFECEDGQYKLTLLTCTPVWKATHRLLIMAEILD